MGPKDIENPIGEEDFRQQIRTDKELITLIEERKNMKTIKRIEITSEQRRLYLEDKSLHDNYPNAFLCVDFDGSEFIYDKKPIRNKLLKIWGYPSMSFSYIHLPEGTIERITGFKMTWENEPEEIFN